jgi:hypothetical protein
MVLFAGGLVELSEDAGDVALDGALAEEQLSGGRPVRPPLSHEPEHLALAFGERVLAR